MVAAKRQAFLPRAEARRLGLCGQVAREPFRFRATTVSAMLRLTRQERLTELSRANAVALGAAWHFGGRQDARVGRQRIGRRRRPARVRGDAGQKLLPPRPVGMGEALATAPGNKEVR